MASLRMGKVEIENKFERLLVFFFFRLFYSSFCLGVSLGFGFLSLFLGE